MCSASGFLSHRLKWSSVASPLLQQLRAGLAGFDSKRGGVFALFIVDYDLMHRALAVVAFLID